MRLTFCPRLRGAEVALPPLVQPGPPLTVEQRQRFSRHLLLEPLGEIGQRRLLASRVLVVGAGGLGAPILLYLAAAGVGHLGIVDDDVVELSNLQRQVIHGVGDVGRRKVDSAAEQVMTLNPDVQVTRHHARLTRANAHEIVSGYDLVLDGTDNFPTRYLVDEVCAELGLPLVWGSILRFDAQVSVFWAQQGVTLRDLFPAPPPPRSTPSCGQAGVLGAMCGQVGSLMAAEAVKLVTGIGEPLLGRVAVLDVLAARWHEVPLRPRAQGVLAPAPISCAEDGAHTSDADAGSARPAAAAVPTISARALARRLAAREEGSDSFVLVDVRETPERAIVSIPGAVHVPLGQVLADPVALAAQLGSDGSQPPGGAKPADNAGEAGDVVVHCRSGARSEQAARALAAAGLAAVNLDGGVLAWVADVDPALPTY